MKRTTIVVHSDVEKFISTLQEKTIAKVLRIIDLLERFGFRLGMPHTKKIQNNLFELRIKGKQEVRFFYGFKQGKIELVHGFIKKQNKISAKEIYQAVKSLENI
ncbi:type II toxin-antitoxin system RelE/ParE family toxin [Patescibacteria group bacterium]|nr:type II toxin-antitoxin system RelE/ParE family toxin [Patescibacteria group bacterium]MBU1885139.1 type II toxin-antitoxin system RelE/ParE family toxin [Patescibacteria group bacterium]